MKWKMVKKGNKWKKRPQLDVDNILMILIAIMIIAVTVSQIFLWSCRYD